MRGKSLLQPRLPFLRHAAGSRSAGASRPCAPPAFTMVELLVVIAVISVLGAILLPTLSRAAESMRQTVCAANMRQLLVLANLYQVDYDNWLAPRCCTNTHAARLTSGTGYFGPECNNGGAHRFRGDRKLGDSNRCPSGIGRSQIAECGGSGPALGYIVYCGGGRMPDPSHLEDYWPYCGLWGGYSADKDQCVINRRNHQTLHEPYRESNIPAQWARRYVMFYDIITADAAGHNAYSQTIAQWAANHQLGLTPLGANVAFKDGSVKWRPFSTDIVWGWNWVSYAASGDWPSYQGFFFSQGTCVSGWTVIPSETVSMCTNSSYYWLVKTSNSHMYDLRYVDTPWLRIIVPTN